MAQIGAVGQPDVAAQARHGRGGPVHQHPAAIEALGEQGGVLVFRWLQHPSALPRHEVASHRQADKGPRSRVPDIYHEIVVTYLGDPGVLYPPALLEAVRARVEAVEPV